MMQFFHLSPDHLLKPDEALLAEATERFGPQKEYGELAVGDQIKQ